MVCHWIKDPDTGENVFIPHCYGALHDPDGCTCEIEGSRLEKAEIALVQANETIERLRENLAWHRGEAESLHRNNNRLRDKIRQMKAETGCAMTPTSQKDAEA